MAEGFALRSVAEALGDVARWKADEESRHNTELAEVDQEVASLQTAIENLKQQLDALGRFRTELLGKLEGIQETVSSRTYEAVFGALIGQLDALSERSAELAVAERERDARLLQTLDDPAVKKLLGEYEQFKSTIEPTLGAMPETYRKAMEALRDQQRAQIAERLGDLGTNPVESTGEGIPVDVLVAVDAPEGEAEVVMLVIPVTEEVHTQWTERAEDLQTRLAARVMQGVFNATRALGLPGAEGVYGGHQGLLAVEVEVAGGPQEQVADAVRAAVQGALDQAEELIAARVKATVRIVDVDNLLPPEDAAEVEVMHD